MSFPEPLTPPECDLRAFPFMPLDIIKLFGSRFHAIASDAEWRAGVTLWLKSFHQVPAASIPDDDIELARLAEFGRDVRAWRKVRDVALHGWVKCSDGRLYHPVVADKANEAAKKKDAYRDRSKKANAARWKRGRSEDESGGGEGVQDDSGSLPEGSPKGLLQGSNKDGSSYPSASQGRVNREEREKPSSPNIKVQPSRANPTRSTDCLNEVCEAAHWHPRTDEARIEALSVIDGWLAEGFDFRLEILAGIGRAIEKQPGKTSSLKRFTTTIRGIHADRRHSRPRNGASVLPRTEGADPEVAAGIRNLAQTLGARMAAE